MSAIHYQYNLVERSVECEHLPCADAFGLGVLAWSPQARGRLARTELDGVAPTLAAALRTIAGSRGVGVGTVALAWLLAKEALPVVGARSPGQLAPSLDAAELRLTEDEVARLDGADEAPPYPQALMAHMRAGIGVDTVSTASSGNAYGRFPTGMAA